MKIKTIIKKIKRFDILKINWIDAGIKKIARPLGSLKMTQKKCSKKFLWRQLRSILVMEKKIYFWCVMLKDKTSKALFLMALASSL